MEFTPIDLASWARKEHFEHYLHDVRCSYSATVHIDITELDHQLKSKGLKAYPAQIYMLATVVNQFPEFRISMDAQGRLGYWETVWPLYTVLNQETESFSGIWTPYSSGFHDFYKACLMDTSTYATGNFAPQKDTPPNIFTISSIPWVDFTAFNINTFTKGDYLLPIFTIGKYTKSNGRISMPLAIQAHHAVCDGLHLGRFVESLREIACDVNRWLF